MSGATKWGLVAAIKAPPAQVLAFAAHHLALGAHRLFVHLDDENQAAFEALSAHPKCRPVLTNAPYWEKLGMKRRVKHQARQTENARHAYGRAAGQVAWLAHIDVDEFLSPLPSAAPIGQQLAALPPGCLSARMRPAEALAPLTPQPVTHFKMLHPERATRDRYARALWPDYGAHPNGGFLSHVAGKLFYRTGVAGLRVQIHNIFVQDQMNPAEAPLPDTLLLHCHAPSWQAFLHHFAYRHAKGSYRGELRPGQQDGLTLHQLFAYLLDTGGEAALQRFYATVCTATPTLLHGLQKHGLLYSCQMDLAQKLRQHFPNASHLADMVQ
ncbi:MAG: glycosyltransferase family 2 protein [Rhodobacteraceae bacterium]|nr:glycosyltransferase family 2 protein [Paracoccaceae bacterium]